MLPSGDAVPRITAAPRSREPDELTDVSRVPPAVKGLSLVSLFNDFASEMVYPLLPAFVTGTLGGGAALLGLLDGAADLTSAVLKVVSGRLADRPALARAAHPRRLRHGRAGAAADRGGGRGVAGGGLPGGRPGREGPPDAAAGRAHRRRSRRPALRGRAFGFHRAADHFGAVLGSLAAWYLLTRGVEVRRVIEWSVRAGAGRLRGAGGRCSRGARAVPAAATPVGGDRRIRAGGSSGRRCWRSRR